MAEPRVVWRSGQSWRNLTEDVRDLAVTVVSRSGAVRLLDLRASLHDRRPLEGGHQMLLDGVSRPLESFTLTPCGLQVIDSVDWAVGTRVWIVVEGLHEQWATTRWGREIVDAIVTGRQPQAPDHPAGVRWRCPTLPGR